MKKLRVLQGGYPRQQDFLLNLQTELFAVTNGLFGKLNKDMVLQGCAVVDNLNGTINIDAGIVYVGGEAVRFDGANNVLANGTKTFVKAGAVTSDPKLFADGNTKDVYSEVKAVIGDKTGALEIAITTSLYTLETYINDVVASYAIKGEFKDIYDFDNTFLANFDSSGLGVTPRYSGWAIANGNNGTPNLQGRVRISAGDITDTGSGLVFTYANGDQGGEVRHQLTVSELPTQNVYAGTPQVGGRPSFGSGPVVRWPTAYGPVGGNVPHQNMQPYLAVYTIVKIV
jgi:hypothetical protein